MPAFLERLNSQFLVDVSMPERGLRRLPSTYATDIYLTLELVTIKNASNKVDPLGVDDFVLFRDPP